ncbi:hypothetical protein TNCV_2774611 [Trichonephila clavipes]|nr:hypothetical protein TNCV_2774611 [Trichonephila clavipes]
MEEERRMNERIVLEEKMRLKKERWHIERCKKADEEAHVYKRERDEILNAYPDAVAQPVAVEEEKGLSTDSSNVPPISAKDETYEIKVEIA